MRDIRVLVILGALLCMWGTVSIATPLSAGTKLSVTSGNSSGFNLRCTVGSCFGIEIAPGLINWTDIVPGLDGGIIVGKQQSTWPGPIIPEINPCELAIVTAQGTTGCFVTAPAAETNVFDDASCDGTACLGKTEVKSLSLAGFGNLSGACAVGGNCPGVQKWAVTSSAYSLDYAWTIPSGTFAGTKTYLHIAGNVQLPGNQPPVAIISPANLVVPPGVTVTLNGSQSYDPDGVIVCYKWEIPGVVLPAVCDPKVSFQVLGVPGTMSVKLTVTDNLGAQGSSIVSVYVAYELPPYADDVSVGADSGQTIFWKPLVYFSYPPNCHLTSLPANGTATVASDCSTGTYQSNAGFVGIDRFTYAAGFGGNDGIVTVAVTEGPVDQICVQSTPIVRLTQIGKSGTLTINFSGNILWNSDKVVKICPGTTLSYQATSTQGPVVCKVKNNTTRDSGRLKINDHIKCSDKPAGKDKVHFKIKSGIS